VTVNTGPGVMAPDKAMQNEVKNSVRSVIIIRVSFIIETDRDLYLPARFDILKINIHGAALNFHTTTALSFYKKNDIIMYCMTVILFHPQRGA
jgi:hypothetical protein